MSFVHEPRLAYYSVEPDLFGQFARLSTDLHKSVLGHKLLALIDVRVSQINGCAFCIDMHSKQAKLAGERELRLYALAAWRESPLFDERERAALAFAEAVTKLGESGVPDDVYREAAGRFSEVELAHLTLAVATINAWNRIAITFRSTPGSMDKAYGLDRAGLS